MIRIGNESSSRGIRTALLWPRIGSIYETEEIGAFKKWDNSNFPDWIIFPCEFKEVEEEKLALAFDTI